MTLGASCGFEAALFELERSTWDDPVPNPWDSFLIIRFVRKLLAIRFDELGRGDWNGLRSHCLAVLGGWLSSPIFGFEI